MAERIRPGQRFGRLVVVIPRGRVTKKDGTQREHYSPLCLCDCGNWCSPASTALRYGRTSSCGCFKKESQRDTLRIRGGKSSPEYTSWAHAKRRCRNPNANDYARYGGRGVTFSPVFDDFEVFLAEVGPRPSPQHSIDRIKGDRGYEPGNIRWATTAEQNRNTRRNVWVSVNGNRMVLKDAADLLGISYKRVKDRKRIGWPPERWFEPHQATVTLCD